MFAPLALLAATSGLPVDGTDASAQPVAEVASQAADSDQLLLFAVELDNAILTESLTAYGDPADPMIPMGELSRLLSIDLDVQPAARLVTGRIGESQRAISIDLAAGKALIGGKSVALVPPDAKITPSDIYLRASLVQKLLPLLINVLPDELLLVLRATEKLPLQSRRDRAGRIASISNSPDRRDETLEVATPYRWIGQPAFDFGLELGGDSARGRATTRFEGRLAVDMLQTALTGFVATDDNGALSAARIKAERRSPDGTLFGPLGATYAAAGDVYSPALVLGPRSGGGAGLVVSSSRVEDTSVFQRINLRGELPIGYDVELYVNDILRSGRQGSQTAGRYEFNDVPLVRGRNLIRIVYYGSRGERSEQTRVINVGGGQLAAGQTVINAGIVAQDDPVISFSDNSLQSGNHGRGAMRAVVEVAQGLTAGFTASAGLGVYDDFSGMRHEVLTGGFRTSFLGLALQGDIANNFKGGSAASMAAAGRFGDFNFVARHVEYSGKFADEANVAWNMARPLTRYSDLTFDLGIPLPGQVRLPLSGRIDRASYADGGTTFSARGRTTVSIADTIVAVGADYNRRTGPSPTAVQFTGSLSASRFVDYKWQLRANAEYEFKPTFALRALGATADRALGDRYSLRFAAYRNFASKDVSLQAGISAHLPFAEATLGGNWSTTQNRWRVGLQLNFGLAFDPLARGYRITPPGPANGGSASLLAFIDNNANGLFDPGEEPVPGVVLQGAARVMKTDAAGRAFVTGLGEGASAILRADTSSTDTVFVTSPPQNIAFAPRAGSVAQVLYPMVPSSELVIRLKFRQQDGTLTGLSAVRLQLVPETGAPVDGHTEFDGSVIFESMTPGHYRLQLDPDQAGKLGMRLVAPIELAVLADGRTVSAEGEVIFTRRSLQ